MEQCGIPFAHGVGAVIYYQPNYKDANFILVTTDEPRAMWFPGDKAPAVKPTALLGSIEWTYAILTSMGIVLPPVLGYTSFPSMAQLYRREIGRCAIGELHPGMFPLFVKPANNLKHWTGQVFADITDLPDIGDDYVCDHSEPVEFTDEIRTFWRRIKGAWALEGCVAYPQIDDEPDFRFEDFQSSRNRIRFES